MMFGSLTRRVEHLAGTMAAFRRNEFTQKVLYEPLPPADKRDAIDCAAAIYNEMVELITEQMRELQRQDEIRRDLIANVSHDLRTPIASLRCYLDTLVIKDDTLCVEARREYVGTAARRAEELSQLVGEMFELVKLEAKDAQIQAEDFPLSELMQDVIQEFDIDARRQGIALATHVAQKLPFVHGDIGLIERVLQNLIINALRNTPSGGSINVNAIAACGWMTVSVSDSGCGIPADQLPRVFDRLYRVDTSRDRRSGGIGLGLAIVRRIVELHRGRIAVNSVLGRGTSFRFTIPLSLDPRTDRSVPPPAL